MGEGLTAQRLKMIWSFTVSRQPYIFCLEPNALCLWPASTVNGTITKKIGNTVKGVECYSIERLREIITSKDIAVAILTVPVYSAKDMAKELVQAGIKGILNFTTINLSVPENIYLEEYDMITSIEKVAYFVKNTYKSKE